MNHWHSTWKSKASSKLWEMSVHRDVSQAQATMQLPKLTKAQHTSIICCTCAS